MVCRRERSVCVCAYEMSSNVLNAGAGPRANRKSFMARIRVT